MRNVQKTVLKWFNENIEMFHIKTRMRNVLTAINDVSFNVKGVECFGNFALDVICS